MKPYKLFAVTPAFTYICVGLVCLFAVYSFARTPIIAGDTDLWFHLSNGRYMSTHQAVPSDSFFSFIAPPRPMVDYSWLFQWIAYNIYSRWDYYGVIALRTGLYAVTLALVGWFLTRPQEKDTARLFCMLLFALYVVFLLRRWAVVRPHMFSYALTVAFLCILESKARSPWRLGLPLLGVLWANVHGVSYPVMLLLAFAYLAEIGWSWWRAQNPITSPEPWVVVPILLTVGTVFLTPLGWRLLEAPFEQLGPWMKYAGEARPVNLTELFTLQISLRTLTPSYQAIANVLIWIACASVLVALVQRKIRLSHLLLFAGGAVLFTRGLRFTYEFVLLSLPVIRATPLIPARWSSTRRSQGVIALLAVLGMGMCVATLHHILISNRPKYPVAPVNLPVGITTFLHHVDRGGRVLNHPRYGGYLQWMLFPRYKIFMDMELANVFTAEDLEIGFTMFEDRQVLGQVLGRYKPDFITVSIRNSKFKQLIEAFPEYAVVFFDDADVLYVNAQAHPDIARQFEVWRFDPFSLVGNSVDVILQRSAQPERRAILEQVLTVYPTGVMVNQILGFLARREGASDKALAHAEVLLEYAPEAPVGYRLKAEVLSDRQLWRESIYWYREALKRASGQGREDVARELGLAYEKLGQTR